MGKWRLLKYWSVISVLVSGVSNGVGASRRARDKLLSQIAQISPTRRFEPPRCEDRKGRRFQAAAIYVAKPPDLRFRIFSVVANILFTHHSLSAAFHYSLRSATTISCPENENSFNTHILIRQRRNARQYVTVSFPRPFLLLAYGIGGCHLFAFPLNSPRTMLIQQIPLGTHLDVYALRPNCYY